MRLYLKFCILCAVGALAGFAYAVALCAVGAIIGLVVFNWGDDLAYALVFILLFLTLPAAIICLNRLSWFAVDWFSEEERKKFEDWSGEK